MPVVLGVPPGVRKYRRIQRIYCIAEQNGTIETAGAALTQTMQQEQGRACHQGGKSREGVGRRVLEECIGICCALCGQAGERAVGIVLNVIRQVRRVHAVDAADSGDPSSMLRTALSWGRAQ